MQESFKTFLLTVCEAEEFKKLEVIQSLWSGYGEIARYELENSPMSTVVVKHISVKGSNEHPRGWNTSNSHNRKIKSYQVETNWYQNWPNGSESLYRTARFIGAHSIDNERWIVLEDLNAHFPLRKQHVNLKEIKSCLQWLANFHASHLNQEPKGLWKIGTYWHLDTRPDELAQMDESELKNNASWIDCQLNQAKYLTIVHGDAKLANFCFSEDGSKVAAVDFQYVGGGCGMKDVAYFLGSCLNSDQLEALESELLDFYFSELHTTLQILNQAHDFTAIEQEWRHLYPFACADFTRFLLGWMPNHQKINDYNFKKAQEVLGSI